MGLKKYCNHAGCTTLVDYGVSYCDKHTIDKTERDREYDKTVRNKKSKEFYNSNEWKMARAKALARDDGIDIFLFITIGKVKAAAAVHHIMPLKEDYTRRADPDNLISLSADTHSYIETQYKKGEASKKQLQKVLYRCITDYQTFKRGGG